jgi:hypothetical protein
MQMPMTPEPAPMMPPPMPMPGQTYGVPMSMPKTGQPYGAPAPYDKSSSDADMMTVYQGKNKELEMPVSAMPINMPMVYDDRSMMRPRAPEPNATQLEQIMQLQRGGQRGPMMTEEMAMNPSGELRGLMKQRDYLNAEITGGKMPMYGYDGAYDGEVVQMPMQQAEPTVTQMEQARQLDMMIADQVAKDKKEIMSKIPGYSP